MHDFPCLVEHFHFLFGIAVIRENVYLRNQVKSQLIGEFLHRRCFPCQDLPVLIIQFVHSCCACAARCLIGRYTGPGDVAQWFDGF